MSTAGFELSKLSVSSVGDFFILSSGWLIIPIELSEAGAVVIVEDENDFAFIIRSLFLGLFIAESVVAVVLLPISVAVPVSIELVADIILLLVIELLWLKDVEIMGTLLLFVIILLFFTAAEPPPDVDEDAIDGARCRPIPISLLILVLAELSLLCDTFVVAVAD